MINNVDSQTANPKKFFAPIVMVVGVLFVIGSIFENIAMWTTLPAVLISLSALPAYLMYRRRQTRNQA